MSYSIIIPIHNEEKAIPRLLKELKIFSNNNQILLIDDGSTDSSLTLLSECLFIDLISLNKNFGKGYAICSALKLAKNDKIIITDGDLELKTSELKKLMILSKNNITSVFGSRFIKINPLKSYWSFGNFIFTKLFNLKHNYQLNDALCCAKAFYKKDVPVKDIKSKSFDIDIEIASILIKKETLSKTILLSYQRRSVREGKKLRLKDSWKILLRIIFT